jgi:hypothetical protein
MPPKSSLAPTGIVVRATQYDIIVTFDLDGRTYETTFIARDRYLDRVAVFKHTAKGTTFWQTLGGGVTLARVAALAAAHLAADPTRADADQWRAVAERFAR